MPDVKLSPMAAHFLIHPKSVGSCVSRVTLCRVLVISGEDGEPEEYVSLMLPTIGGSMYAMDGEAASPKRSSSVPTDDAMVSYYGSAVAVERMSVR